MRDVRRVRRDGRCEACETPDARRGWQVTATKLQRVKEIIVLEANM